ncbi:DUF4810 domain-containing protein [Aliiglaciecola litoralis]|uniref:DUF4810 domain-containing protein n=1 Tax=Aliiglaciecola litoralis TaxID=582857 RepID=A0ABN1LS82_9ALTE
MKKLAFVGLLVLLMGGCAANKDMLYWGDYSSTLYDYKKEPSDETRAAHVESLEDIIAKSTQRGTRIPPGVYAELGYMHIETGSTELGAKYLQLEVDTYPESQKFISTIQQRITE